MTGQRQSVLCSGALVVACSIEPGTLRGDAGQVSDESAQWALLSDAGDRVSSDLSQDVTPREGDTVTSTVSSSVRKKTLALGTNHTCALLEDATVKCWGNNAYGQTGDAASTVGNRYAPVEVSGLTNVLSIAAGSRHTCAITADSKVRCWGNNVAGQLGNGSSGETSPVVDVQGLVGAVDVDCGTHHTCALLTSGDVKCWGHDEAGALGESSNPAPYKAVPVHVENLVIKASAIATGGEHSCALLQDSSLKCWGADFWDQLGDGDGQQNPRFTAVTVDGVSGVRFVAAGYNNTCASHLDGTVACWGYGGWGQLGAAVAMSDRGFVPVMISELTQVDSIAVGDLHVCVLTDNRSVWCWGSDQFGEIGDGPGDGASKLIPVAILGPDAGSTPIVELQTGGWHNCVRTSDGETLCWGRNEFGHVGAGDQTGAPQHRPTRVEGL